MKFIPDQYLDLDSLEFNSNDLIIDLKMEGIDSSDYKITRGFISFKRIKYPILLSKIIFKGVSSYNIIDDQKIGTYSINDLTLADKNLTLNFCEATKLNIYFDDQVNIEINDFKRLND